MAPGLDELVEAYRIPDRRLGGHERAAAVLIGDKGITVLCNASSTDGGEHPLLIGLSADGEPLWERRYPEHQGAGRAIVALPDGGFAIAGEARVGELEYAGRVLWLDAGAEVIDDRSLGEPGTTGLTDIAVLSGGGTVAVGTAAGGGWLLGIDSERRTSWEQPIAAVDEVVGVAGLPDGGFALAAIRERSTTELGRAHLARYDSERGQAWQLDLPAEGRGEPAGVAALEGGEVLAVGHVSLDGTGPAQLWAARVDAAGGPVWERPVGSPDAEHRGRGVAALEGGGGAVLGDAMLEGRRVLRLARLAGDGTVAWERSFAGEEGDHEAGAGLAAAPDGGMVIAASRTSTSSGGTRPCIRRLDRDGGLAWERLLG